MSHRTIVPSSYEDYLATNDESLEAREADDLDRSRRLSRFPFSVMLQVSFPELDYANRWCWQHFGPCDGGCTQQYSEYRAFELDGTHSHAGKWTSHWFEKIDYNFGFNEWYFAESADCERFRASLKDFNWGEHYPK